MGFFGFLNTKQAGHSFKLQRAALSDLPDPVAYDDFYHKPYMSDRQVWDGERHWGELGTPIEYISDFRNLAIRSWQSYYESNITQIVINNYLLWTVGRGLALNSEPIDKYILTRDSQFDRESFADTVESLWKIYSQDKQASYSGLLDIHDLAFQAKRNAIIGGDVLVVVHYDGDIPSIQLIDGLHVSTPLGGSWEAEAKSRGAIIRIGVEVGVKGEHKAYYVNSYDGTTRRVEAFNNAGRQIAWLIYGDKYRIDDVRGVPLMGVVLEELKKLGRYKDATLASAEENAKIALTIEHGDASTGSNPFTESIRAAMGSGMPVVPESVNYADSRQIAMTTQKQVFNLEPGATLKAHKSEGPNSFKDFFTINFEIICASLSIPPEVALGKYDSNYSASRMASKMWETKFTLDRVIFAKDFYKKIYSYWLDTRVLNGDIIEPFYLDCLLRDKRTELIALKNCEFIGPGMPHIDPLKEVNAELAKINGNLTTYEKATRNLNDGDWHQNASNLKKERDTLVSLGLKSDKTEDNDEL